MEGYIIFAAMIATGMLVVILGLAASVFLDGNPRVTVAQRLAKGLGDIGGFVVHALAALLTVLAMAFLNWLLNS